MAQLQAGQRQQIKTKHFAIPGKEKYPIHDVAHARNALVRVRQFGTPGEKSQVYSAVTKKYPALATRSEVIPQKLQRKAERKAGVGKGQESMKLEAPKQKLSSVTLAAFTDEVGQIKQAVSAQWIGSMISSGMKKQPLWKRALTAGRSSKPLEVSEKLLGRRAARTGLPETIKAMRTARNPLQMYKGMTEASMAAQPKMQSRLMASPQFAQTRKNVEGIMRGVTGLKKQLAG